MKSQEFTEYYYSKIVGREPEENYRIETEKVIQHLIDNNISQEDIYNFIDSCDCKNYLTHKDLNNELWKDSLLKKNKFYYHKNLQIVSKPPSLDGDNIITEDFYLEMKIKYSVDDIIKYFYDRCRLPQLSNAKQDRGSIEFLLKKYSKVKFVEPVDFVLSLIDYAADNQSDIFNKVRSILELSTYEINVYEILKAKTDEASSLGLNKIIWR